MNRLFTIEYAISHRHEARVEQEGTEMLNVM